MSADDTKLVETGSLRERIAEAIWEAGYGQYRRKHGKQDVKWPDSVIGQSQWLFRQMADGVIEALALEAFEAKNAAMAAENATLREALTPFADFIDPVKTAFPDDMPMTRGSWIAARQVTAGDFRRARAALRQEAGR